VVLLHLGPQSARVGALFRSVPVISDGFLPAEEVSLRLSACDVFLAPFVDGVSTRRTTLMAALQHGIPTVGTAGFATDRVLLDAEGDGLLLTPTGDAAAFGGAVARLSRESALARRLSRGGSALFAREFSWPVIARRLLDGLRAS